MLALPCSERHCRRDSPANSLSHTITLISCTLSQNEPHTRDLYEHNRGWAPGQLVRNWLWEMAAYVKNFDGNHMVGCTIPLCVEVHIVRSACCQQSTLRMPVANLALEVALVSRCGYAQRTLLSG